jgi:hypothetical protein
MAALLYLVLMESMDLVAGFSKGHFGAMLVWVGNFCLAISSRPLSADTGNLKDFVD